MELREDDAFWAARRVMAFTDDLIGAAVHAGQFSDPAAERHLAAVLAKRRDAIGRTYLSSINPIVDPHLDADGRLSLTNAAVEAGSDLPTAYHATWFRFDNATGATQPLGTSQSATTSLPPPQTALPHRPVVSSRSTSLSTVHSTHRGGSRCTRSSVETAACGNWSASSACQPNKLLRRRVRYRGSHEGRADRHSSVPPTACFSSTFREC
jgi:hypothetical protein